MRSGPLKYGFVGAGFNAKFHLAALRQLRGIEVAGVTAVGGAPEFAAMARGWGLGETVVYDSVYEMAQHVDCVAVCAPNFARVPIVEADRRGRQARRGAEGRDLREAARAQRRRGAAPRGHGAVGEAAHGLLREPDLHEADPEPAGAARAGPEADGAALAGPVGRGARRAARRLVLGPDAAGRRRPVRHGLPQHRGGVARADAGRQAAHLPPAAGGERGHRAAQVGPARPGGRSC